MARLTLQPEPGIQLAFKIGKNGAPEGRFYNLESGAVQPRGHHASGNAVKDRHPRKRYDLGQDRRRRQLDRRHTDPGRTDRCPRRVDGQTAELPPPAALKEPPAGTKLEFEVASVKQNVSGEDRTRMITQPGGRLIVTNALVRNLIATAFAMADPQSMINARILGGPDWIGSERYDINAKANIEFRPSPDGPPRELLLMIRSLLEERFKLKAHRETRELPIYELVVARADRRLGPEMRKPAADCDAAIAAGTPPPRQPGEPPPCGLTGGPARTIAGGATMQQLAANLTVRQERLVFGKPV